MYRRACAVALLASIVAVGGCGDGGPKLYPVEGTVTIDGQPLEGAMVTFTSNGLAATGLTTPSGKFKLLHLGKEGCPAGTHKVTVVKSEKPNVTPAISSGGSGPDNTKMYLEAMKQAAKSGAPVGSMKMKSLIPEKYATNGGLPDQVVPATSEIVIELSSGAKK